MAHDYHKLFQGESLVTQESVPSVCKLYEAWKTIEENIFQLETHNRRFDSWIKKYTE